MYPIWNRLEGDRFIKLNCYQKIEKQKKKYEEESKFNIKKNTIIRENKFAKV